MKKIIVLLTGIILSAGTVKANIAFATFASVHNYDLQIIIDGIIINSKPKPVVKIKGKPGLRQLTIKAFDKSGCLVDVFKDSFYVKSGLASDYKIYTNDEGFLQLKCTGYKMIYHERLRRPDWFYNNRNFAMHIDYTSACSRSIT